MTTRVDSWIWSVRLTKTRSAAGAACRGGHVQVNAVTAKPSLQLAVGDRVTVRLQGRERIVEVTRLIAKRVGAPVAAECFIDHSPPPPPPEVIASIPRRDRGAGRPTKRERRQLDRLRSPVLLVAVAAIAAAGLTACGSDDGGGSAAQNTTSEVPYPGDGPRFDRCGGLTDDRVRQVSGISGFSLFIDNTSVCEWRTDVGRQSNTVSFNWYRGSPIGRELENMKSGRDKIISDLDIGGKPSYLAAIGSICEVMVDYESGFLEISVNIGDRAGGAAADTDRVCDVATTLARDVVGNAR